MLTCKERRMGDAVGEFFSNVTDIFCQFSDVWRRMWVSWAQHHGSKVLGTRRTRCMTMTLARSEDPAGSHNMMQVPAAEPAAFSNPACCENDVRVLRAAGLSRHP